MSGMESEEFGSEELPEGFDPEPPAFPGHLVTPLTELVELGHLETVHRAFGHEYVIRTLTTGEELRAMALTRPWAEVPVAQGRAFATAIVAGALVAVDDEETARGNSPRDDGLKARFKYVQELYWPVVDSIYQAYLGLERKQAEVLAALEEAAEDGGPDEDGTQGTG